MKNDQHGLPRRSLSEKIATLFGPFQPLPDDVAPSLENLEPRVLLSANPLADALRYQDGSLLNSNTAIMLPLTAGPGQENAPAAGNNGALRAAPRATQFPPELSFVDSFTTSVSGAKTVQVDLWDLQRSGVEWTLSLTSKDTGETIILGQGVTPAGAAGARHRVAMGQIDPAVLADGNYQLVVEALDTVTGKSARRAVGIAVDTTDPVIESVTSSHETPHTNQPMTFTVKASDNIGVSRIEVFVNGEKYVANAYGQTYSVTFWEAGTYRVEAYVYDNAGHVAVHVQDLVVAQGPDLIPPKITMHSPTADRATRSDLPVRINIQDQDSIVINWQVRLVNNDTGEVSILATGDKAVWNTQVATVRPADFPDGSYTLVIEAIDAGGNRTAKDFQIDIDTTPPVVSVEAETSRLEAEQRIWFTVGTVDATKITKRTLTVNGKTVAVDANGRAQYTFATPGEYTLIATATDAAGNVGTVTRIITVTANTDVTPPGIVINAPDYAGKMTSIRATITDTDSDTVSWTVRLRRPNGQVVVLATGSGKMADEVVASVNAAIYPAGKYVIEVEAVDAAGNSSTATHGITFDRVEPWLSLTGPGPNSRLRQPVNVTGTLQDIDTDLSLVSWSVTLTNTVTGQTYTVLTGKGAPVGGVYGVLDPTLYANGTYQLTLRAVDPAGNQSSTSRNVHIDTVAPTVSLSSSATEVDSWGYVTYTITTGSDVAVSSRRLIVDGKTYNVGADGTVRVQMTKAGVRDVVAEVTDTTGNVGRATLQITVNDVNAPGVSIHAPAGNASIGKPVGIQAGIGDRDSSDVEWRLTLVSKATGQVFELAQGRTATTPTATTLSLHQLDPALYASGEYQLVVDVVDAAGHTGRHTITITLDTVAPTIESVTVDQASPMTDTPLKFKIKAGDNIGVRRYELTIDGVTYPVNSNGESSAITFKQPGTYRVVAYAYDDANNMTTYTYDLVVRDANSDTEAPVVTLTSEGDKRTAHPTQSIRFQAKATDNVGVTSFVVTVDGEAVTVGADGYFNYTFTKVGTYTVKAVATDAAGLTDEKIIVITVTPDSERPVVTLTSDKTEVHQNQSIRFQAKADDNVGLKSFVVTVDGKPVTVGNDGYFDYTFGTVGTYTVRAVATDTAGNTTEAEIIVTVTPAPDTEAPVVTLTSEGDKRTAHPTQSIRFQAKATDNVGITSFVVTVDGEAVTVGADGYFNYTFTKVGTYTVKAVATDAAGLTSEQTITITVTPDSEKPVVTLTSDKTEVHQNQSIRFQATADDNVGLKSFVVTVDGKPVTVGNDGYFDYTFGTVGTYLVRAVATDTAGNTTEAEIIVTVTPAPDTEAPVVTLTSEGDKRTAHPTQSIRFQAKATDNVGVTSFVVTVDGEAVTVGADGYFNYTFTKVGTYTVKAVATDAAGLTDEKIIVITVTPDTERPVVTLTSDKTEVHQNQSIRFQATADDNVGLKSFVVTVDGKPVTVGNDGYFDYTFGTVGTYLVRAVATDTAGNTTEAEIIVTVTPAPDTEAPVVTLTSEGDKRTAHPTQSIRFQAKATDNVGVTSFVVTVDGEAVTVGADGYFNYTFTKVGTYTVKAVATDAAGLTSEQTITITVTPDAEKPVVTLTSDKTEVHQNQSIRFQAKADDNVGLKSFVVTVDGKPVTVGNDGYFDYTFGTVGTYLVRAIATDTAGNTTEAEIIVTVTPAPTAPDMEPPTVTLTHDRLSTKVSVGETAKLTASAEDNVGVTSLIIEVNGVIVAENYTGELLDAHYEFGSPGTYVVKVTAVDAAGLSKVTTEVFNVPEVVDKQPPTLTVDPVGDLSNLKVGQTIRFKVTATDNVGVTRVELSLILDEWPIRERYQRTYDIDADGYVTIVLEKSGTFRVEAKGWDAAGNWAFDDSYHVISVANDSSEKPSISFGGHLGLPKHAGHRVDAATEIVASITGDVAGWQVILVDNKTNVSHVLASGTGPVSDAVLAHLDTSVIANGSYGVRIVATDSNGISTTAEKQIVVASNVKLGNFELPLQDLNISVGGFNVQLNRIYNSLDSGYRGDFGYGWNLGTLPISLAVSNPFNHGLYGTYANNMVFFTESAWTNTTVISINLPDGSVAQFDVNLRDATYHPTYGKIWTMTLDCISGHNITLKIDDEIGSMNRRGGFYTTEAEDGSVYISHESQGGFFNPTRNSKYYKTTYELTMEDGTTYVIDAQTGLATGMKAADGRRLEITEDGVVAYAADGSVIEQVRYVRDAEGRITSVVDPSGSVISYGYDANGDLVSVTRAGQTTTYEYVDVPGAPAHYLKTIRGPDGKVVMDVDYDYATGRINAITDANGNRTSVDYSVQSSTGDSVEKVTDAAGLVTETVVDARGNAIRTIQHLPDPADPSNPDKFSYLIAIADYDARGNLLGTARAFTVTAAELAAAGADRFDYWPSDLVWEQRNTYDATGHMLTSTDVYGNTTHYEYDARGNVTKTTDHRGGVTENVYDTIGRIEQSTDANGTVTDYEYNLQGQLTAIYQTQPGGARELVSGMTYDAMGRVKTSVDRDGVTTHYHHDANGRQTYSGRTWTDPDTGMEHWDETDTAYNAAGQVQRRTRRVDGVLQSDVLYEYDAFNGLLVGEFDYLHDTAVTYRYDAAGQVVETVRKTYGTYTGSVNLVSRVVYDAMGREIWSSEEYLDSTGNADTIVCRATKTVYDILGRVVRTEVRDNVAFSLTWSDGYVSAVTDEGTLVSYDATGFDGAGRTGWTENANGVKTVYVYTREGDAQYTITDLDGDLTTTDDQTVVGRTEYDSEGKQTASVMDRDGDLATTGDQTVTRYHYDDKGRVTATHYADGSFTHVTYDALGRKASETDKAGNTTYYEYDDMGRLTAVVLPQVQHPVSGNMVHVRYEYGYDSRGNQISLTDNLYMDSPQGYVSRTDARTTTFTFDGHNRQTSRTLPDGLTEYFFYNDHGQQVRHLSFEGRVTVMQYDTLGRLERKSYYATEALWNNGQGTAGQTITYEYDAFGRVIRETDSRSGTTTTTYDAHGQVTRIESPTGVINYEYDPVTGQVTRTWTGANASNPVTDIRNTYDVHGRLETVETHAREGSRLTTPEVARYTYDVLGNLSTIRHSNGIVTTYTYDYLNRLTEVSHVHDNNTPDNTADDVLVEKFEYHYHATGDKAAEFATDKDGNQNVWEWDYDALGRLINERHQNHDYTQNFTAEYVFDLVGNRLEKTTVNAEGIEKIISAFDQNDRLLNEKTIFNSQDKKQTDYRYNGTEQVGKTVTDLAANKVESKTTIEYNEQGRMAKITIDTYLNGALAKRIVQEYEYDASGIKVRQTESVDEDGNGAIDTRKVTEYLNDAMNHTGYSQVLEERTSENGGTVKVTTYTIGHDVLAQFNAAAGFLALLADGHGSTRAVADNNGTIVQQYNYDAYGNAHGFDASQALTNLLYSGEQFNPVSGLQYLRARWYNPQSGTFNRLDPFAGDKGLPQTYHKYAYATSNPILHSDPSGWLSPILALILSSALIGAAVGVTYYTGSLIATNRLNEFSGWDAMVYGLGGAVAGAVSSYMLAAGFSIYASAATGSILSESVSIISDGITGANEISSVDIATRLALAGIIGVIFAGGLSKVSRWAGPTSPTKFALESAEDVSFAARRRAAESFRIRKMKMESWEKWLKNDLPKIEKDATNQTLRNIDGNYTVNKVKVGILTFCASIDEVAINEAMKSQWYQRERWMGR